MKPLRTRLALSEIATCMNGFTFREKPIHVSHGLVRVIQTGDISADNEIDLERALTTSIDVPNQKFVLQADDILFRGRGETCVSVLVPKHKQETIAASPFIFIRSDKKQILPAYLNLVLNSALAHSFFRKLAQGSLIKSIGLKELLQLQVPLPTILEQSRIVAISACFHRERLLLKSLTEKRERILTHLLLNHSTPTKRTSA